MQHGKSYIRDSENFLSKIRYFTSTPYGLFLVTAEVDSIPVYVIHMGLMALSLLLKIRRKSKYLLAIYLKWLNLSWVIVALNFLMKFPIDSRTVIGTKFAPPALVFIWTK